MDSEFVIINCFCTGFPTNFFMRFLKEHLSQYSNCKIAKIEDDDFVARLKIGDKNIKIKVSTKRGDDINVCMIIRLITTFSLFSKAVRLRTSECNEHFPTTPVIIVGTYDKRRHKPEEIKKAEIAGDKIIDRKIGDGLARELGAVKFVEFSQESGRGARILIDEIAYAGLGKIKDDEKQHKNGKCAVF